MCRLLCQGPAARLYGGRDTCSHIAGGKPCAVQARVGNAGDCFCRQRPSCTHRRLNDGGIAHKMTIDYLLLALQVRGCCGPQANCLIGNGCSLFLNSAAGFSVTANTDSLDASAQREREHGVHAVLNTLLLLCPREWHSSATALSCLSTPCWRRCSRCAGAGGSHIGLQRSSQWNSPAGRGWLREEAFSCLAPPLLGQSKEQLLYCQIPTEPPCKCLCAESQHRGAGRGGDQPAGALPGLAAALAHPHPAGRAGEAGFALHYCVMCWAERAWGRGGRGDMCWWRFELWGRP